MRYFFIRCLKKPSIFQLLAFFLLSLVVLAYPARADICAICESRPRTYAACTREVMESCGLIGKQGQGVQQECKKQAQQLQDQLRRLPATPVTYEDVKDACEEERWWPAPSRLRPLVEEWTRLREVCLDRGTDIGFPPFQFPRRLPPTFRCPKSEEEKNQARTKIDLLTKQAERRRKIAAIEELACRAKLKNVSIEVGIGIGEGGKGSVAVSKDIGDVVCGKATEKALRRALGLDDQADAVDRWIKDPPSPDYMQVLEPVVDPEPVSDNATALERLTAGIVEAERWVTAYLRAYVAALERYQGAQAAEDWGAMIRQAEAMVKFADSGMAWSRTAAMKEYAFEHVWQAQVEQAQAQAVAQGARWEDWLAAELKRLQTEGVSQEVRDAITAAGVPEAEIIAFEKRLLSLTSAQVLELIALRKQESHLEPRQGDFLESLKRSAHGLREQAIFAPIQSAEASASMNGTWDGGANDWGEVKIEGKTGAYKGTYSATFNEELGGFEFNETGEPRRYKGKWWESDKKRYGSFDLETAEDGNTITIKWKSEHGTGSTGNSTWQRKTQDLR